VAWRVAAVGVGTVDAAVGDLVAGAADAALELLEDEGPSRRMRRMRGRGG
jgi:hypothetical protein